MGVEQIQAEIKALQDRIERYTKTGQDVEPVYIEIQRAERRLAKEEAKLPVHPALVFGPVAQTIAAMSCISLGMSVSDLPYEMYPFYRLFSTITSLAVICLVTRSGIIYYEYSSIISSVPELTSEDRYKEAKLEDWLKRMASATRPDDWLHSRSHPSHFLTTRHAPPRMFPFPLGKTNANATIKDELWWEGGNAPHVGHFNKPQAKIDFPRGIVSQKWLERAKKRLEIDDTRALWKRRIRSIQLLSIVVITSFIYRKAAIILLIYLIYNTLSTEIESMLQPPRSLERLQHEAERVELSMAVERAPGSKTYKYGVQGIGYVYQPEDIGEKGGQNSQIPINTTAAHVLMTSQDSNLIGPGQKIRGEMNYSAI